MGWLPEEQKIAAQRKAGNVLGRSGITDRVREHAEEMLQPGTTYQHAMRCAGRIAALVRAAEFDRYWREKASMGYGEECCWLHWCVEFPERAAQKYGDPDDPTSERGRQ